MALEGRLDLEAERAATLPRLARVPHGPRGGLRWRLPRRPWGAGRWVGPVLILAGAAGWGVLGYAVWRGTGVSPGAQFAAAAGTVLLGLGVFMRFGYAVIELEGRTLRAGERLLGFGWTRVYPVAAVQRLEVQVGTCGRDGRLDQPTPNFAVLCGVAGGAGGGAGTVVADQKPRAASKQKRDAVLAWGYPLAWLRVVAHDLAEALPAGSRVGGRVPVVEVEPHGSATRAGGGGAAGAAPAWAAATAQELRGEPVSEPPAGSDVLVERGGDHLNFVVAGGRDHGLGSMAWMWNAVVLVLIASMAAGSGLTLTSLALLLPFVLVGVAMAAGTYRMKRTQTILDIAGHGADASLTQRIAKPFSGERVQRWAAAELSAVRVAPSRLTVNKQPVMHLELHPVGGKPVGMLSSLSREELSWIAAEVRGRTGVPE